MQQLSLAQIDLLFDFVQRKYARYVDVQHELVDHLATSIEEEMQTSGASFESALQTVYGRFPITGFAKFVQEKEKATRRYWRLRQFAYLKTYFTLPKIVMTVAIFMVVYSIFSLGIVWESTTIYVLALVIGMMSTAKVSLADPTTLKPLIVPVALLAIGLAMAVTIDSRFWLASGITLALVGATLLIRRMKVKHEVSHRQKYLHLGSFYDSLWVGASQLLLFLLYTGDTDLLTTLDSNVYVLVFMAGLVSLSLVFSHAMITHFSKMLCEELEQKYPHLQIV